MSNNIDSYTILWLEWSIGSLSVCISGLLVLNYSDLIPDFVHRIVKYGKSANIDTSSHRSVATTSVNTTSRNATICSTSPNAPEHATKTTATTASERRRKHNCNDDEEVEFIPKQDDALVSKSLQFLELPKRYFFHFYSLALIFYLFLASMVINIYFNINLFGDRLNFSSSIIKTALDYFTSYDYLAINYQRVASVSRESVIIGLSLLIVQVTRRLCECKFVSVYSNARMNIIHYMFGHLFYIGVGLSMLAEAPGFAGRATSPRIKADKFNFFTPSHIIGVALFIWASYVQFDSHRILANLRKDSMGRVITTKHSIPRGKWFDLVSSPHYMAEILIYLAITIVLGGKCLTWWMVFLFVVTNQIFVGKFNHSWYLNTFKDYPKSRRAIIPYLI